MKCRVCKKDLDPLLTLSNFPKAAQYLPSREELNQDTGIDLTLLYCPSCGLVQHDLPPVPYYKDVIRAAAYSAEMKTFREKQFAGFVSLHGLEGKRALEIGAGKGEYLRLLEGAGLAAYGVEHNEASVLYGKEEGLRMIRAFMGDSPVKQNTLPGGPFDAFFSFNFFEHLPDLPGALAAIRSNVTDQAIGLIEVPNFDMILKECLLSEIIPDHIYYFTSDSLTTLLTTNGFDVIDCSVVWHDYILSCTIRKRKKTDVAGFGVFQGQIKQLFHAFLEEHPGGKIAVWGAGHQALAALTMANKDDISKIRFVIDSAPFKQGKYTPVTHIPIVAPSVLDSHDLRAVLIMAAAYSDEIASQIKQKYTNLSIGIVRSNSIEIIY
jgi:SAM-dependent methyltransferase